MWDWKGSQPRSRADDEDDDDCTRSSRFTGRMEGGAMNAVGGLLVEARQVLN